MNCQATFTKTKSAEPVGQYVRTAVDAQRDAADIVLTSICGRYYFNSQHSIAGRNIRLESSHSGRTYYSATEGAFNKLRSQFSMATDF